MKRMMILVVAVGLLAAVTSAHGGDAAGEFWPTWRGPQATGAALKGNPPLTWSETENVKWKVELIGSGSSSPVIWGNKIFYQAAIPTDKKVKPPPSVSERQRRDGDRARGSRRGRRSRDRGRMSRAPSAVYKFVLVCLDRKTGNVLWQKTACEEFPHEGHHPDHGFASYSPVTDGKHIWASFGSRGLHCYDLEGNHKWSRDLIKMSTRMGFGEGSSPALAGDAVVVVMDHEGNSCVFAFSKLTGQQLWKKDRDERTSWATPAAVEVNGKMQVITSATNFIRSYDAKTGALIWKCAGQTTNVIPSPVIGFGNVYCTSGYRGNALQAIKLGRTGDLTNSDAVSWQISDATPYVPSPLLYGDRIYLCSGNKAVISCYQAKTGKANFAKRRLEKIRGIYASPVGAAGRVYFVGRNGVTQVIKHSERLEILATNTLQDKFDASPAIVSDELFLKGKKYFYCVATPPRQAQK